MADKIKFRLHGFRFNTHKLLATGKRVTRFRLDDPRTKSNRVTIAVYRDQEDRIENIKLGGQGDTAIITAQIVKRLGDLTFPESSYRGQENITKMANGIFKLTSRTYRILLFLERCARLKCRILELCEGKK